MSKALGQSQPGVILANRSDIHIIRKIWHMGMGLTALYIYTLLPYSTKEWGLAASVIAAVGLIVDLLRLKNSKFNDLMMKAGGIFYRKSEYNSLSGLPFYALGCGMSLYFFEEKIALLSVLFLVFADPISSYFGVRYGKDKILPNKSLQGTMAGFCVCYILALVWGLYHSGSSLNLLGFSLLAGAVGAISELLSVFIDDNLTIPVVSGLGLTLLNLLFHIF